MFAERLADARRARGWKQRDLARELGVGQSLICHYEQGERMPRLETLRSLCELLECSASELLGW